MWCTVEVVGAVEGMTPWAPDLKDDSTYVRAVDVTIDDGSDWVSLVSFLDVGSCVMAEELAWASGVCAVETCITTCSPYY